jgi:hypothetical protein
MYCIYMMVQTLTLTQLCHYYTKVVTLMTTVQEVLLQMLTRTLAILKFFVPSLTITIME